MERHHVGAARFLRIIPIALFGVCVASLFALGFGWLVKWLWNWLMPDIFGVKMITYWQAFGLIMLARLLVGAFRHGHHPHPPFGRRFPRVFFNRDEEWAPAGDHRNWRYYRQYWRDRGKKDFEGYLAEKRPDDAAGE